MAAAAVKDRSLELPGLDTRTGSLSRINIVSWPGSSTLARVLRARSLVTRPGASQEPTQHGETGGQSRKQLATPVRVSSCEPSESEKVSEGSPGRGLAP